MMKIKLVDSFCTGYVHNKFNAAFISMLVMLHYDLALYVSNSAKINLIKTLKDPKWLPDICHTIYVKEGEGKWNVLFRYLIGAIMNLRYLFSSNKKDILLYNYNNPFSLHIINAFNYLLNRKIIILCHGEMEQLLPDKRGGGYLYRLIGSLLRSFFYSDSFHHRNIFYCVIGETILKNIVDILPQSVSCYFYQFELPYLYNDDSNCYNLRKVNELNGLLSIGTVGTFNEKRGASCFVELAKKLISNNKIRLSITGKVQWGNKELNELNISLPSDGGKGMVGFEEFKNRIRSLDYILYLYPSDSYKLIASAAVMDAIDLRKPIIAIKNAYFEHLFSIYGEFGFLVDNIDEMVDVITKLQKNIISIDVDFDRIQRQSSPHSISKQLEQVLNEITAR